MIGKLVSRFVILTFGTFYPAYNSFKVVQAKDASKYVGWMMYWIVFAIFTCIEAFTDLFLRWFPCYYEMKVLFVLWLVWPVTNGSSILYLHFLQPLLKSKEPEIDRMQEEGYTALKQFLHPLLKSKEPEIDPMRKDGYTTLMDLSRRITASARDLFIEVAQQWNKKVLQPKSSDDRHIESHSKEGDNEQIVLDSKNVLREEGGQKVLRNMIKNPGSCRCYYRTLK